jgi:hypothetical protein
MTKLVRSSAALTVAAILGMALSPSRLHAQTAIIGGVEKLFDRVETVDLYYGFNTWSRRATASRYAVSPKDEFGLEFSFHAGSFGCERPWERKAAKTERKEAPPGSRCPEDSVRVVPPDPTWKARSVTIKQHYAVTGKDSILVGVDSEFVAAPNEKDKKQLVDLDFAIGYGQLGVKANSPYELRGYIRELPSVAMYITRWVNEGLAVYVGAKTGIITLQDGQVFVPGAADTVKIFSVSATSLELGAAAGFFLPLGRGDGAPSFTAEISPTWRNFNSLVFSPSAGTPKNLPHQMDFSGANIIFGLMFPLGKSK